MASLIKNSFGNMLGEDEEQDASFSPSAFNLNPGLNNTSISTNRFSTTPQPETMPKKGMSMREKYDAKTLSRDEKIAQQREGVEQRKQQRKALYDADPNKRNKTMWDKEFDPNPKPQQASSLRERNPINPPSPAPNVAGLKSMSSDLSSFSPKPTLNAMQKILGNSPSPSTPNLTAMNSSKPKIDEEKKLKKV
jgi:hypothetical protein